MISDNQPNSSQEEIKFKFKSISNFRTRKGSEDIALNTCSKNNGSFTPGENKQLVQLIKREDSNLSGSNAFAPAPSFERPLDLGSQVKKLGGTVQVEDNNGDNSSPAKKFSFEPYSGTIPQPYKLQEIEEEDDYD